MHRIIEGVMHSLARDWYLSEPASTSANDRCGWLQRLIICQTSIQQHCAH